MMGLKLPFQYPFPKSHDGDLEEKGSNSESEELLAHRDSQAQRRRSQRQRIFELVSTAVITILLVAAFQWIYHISADRQAFPTDDSVVQETIKSYYGEESVAKYNCGNNSREAISLGCVFDMSAIGWVPHQCQDPYMRDRYDSYGFKYYEDEARTIEASLDRFAASATEEEPRDMFYPTPGFHENHCSLTWERMHRTAMLGKRVLKHVMNFKHTLHCGELLDTPHEFVSLPIAALLHTC